MSKTLTLVPCNTKYASIDYEGHTYEIWKVNPRTGKEGTEVEYKLAVALLSLQPPVVTVLPIIKDGKFVNQLTEADAQKVANSRTGKENILVAHATTTPNNFGGNNDPDLKSVVTQQAQVIEELKAKVAAMEVGESGDSPDATPPDTDPSADD